jgi:hypothetical protein
MRQGAVIFLDHVVKRREHDSFLRLEVKGNHPVGAACFDYAGLPTSGIERCLNGTMIVSKSGGFGRDGLLAGMPAPPSNQKTIRH